MEIAVSAGTIEYREEGDPDGPPVVLLHGLLMNDTQWNLALPYLPAGYRYLLPVLPMGGHRVPMREDADLTMPGRSTSSPTSSTSWTWPTSRSSSRTGAVRYYSPTLDATNASPAL